LWAPLNNRAPEDAVDFGQLGAAVSTIATVIAAIYAVLDFHQKRQSKPMSSAVSEAAPDRRHIIVMISLVFAAWAAVIFDFYTRDSQPSAELIEMWTAQPPVYSMAVNTKELAKYKNGYKIAMIVRVNFADRDLMTDTVIEKSGMYTITGDRIAIAHATSGTLRFAALQPNNIRVFLILLPNSSSIDSVKSIGDVEKFGGKILTSRGQVVIGGPPDGTKISP
jgi:hypothetical protein